MPYINYYGENVIFDSKARLIDNPFQQSSILDNTVWSLHEIQLFLQHFFNHPKDFTRMSTHFPHKSIHQLIEFYYDFKEVFELKEY